MNLVLGVYEAQRYANYYLDGKTLIDAKSMKLSDSQAFLSMQYAV